MKKMNLNFAKIGFVAAFGIIAFCLLSSCGKKSTTPTLSQTKTAKFTMTVNGVTNQDVADFGFNSNAADGSTSLWKLNGTVQNNQQIFFLHSANFTGNTQTYVLESNTPLTGPLIATVACASGTHNFIVSFKAEINGVVKEDDENVTVTPTAGYNHTFTY